MKRLAALVPILASSAYAQCVMCFRTAAAQNSARAHIMNLGILIMGIPPILILVGFLVLCYRRSKIYADTPPLAPAKTAERELQPSLELVSR